MSAPMKILVVDDKWSIQYDPANNDSPQTLLRYGEDAGDVAHWKNPEVAMFYTLLERTDLSQAAVAAALEAAAKIAYKAWDGEPEDGEAIRSEIRALITPSQHDALAAHVAAEVAKARAEDAQAVAYTSSDLIQPASADMSGIDRAMLQSMAASFRGALEFSFNRHDMAELMDRCASRPASADTRTVTVAQLEAWIGAMEDWDEGDAAQKIDDILAIIGDTK